MSYLPHPILYEMKGFLYFGRQNDLNLEIHAAEFSGETHVFLQNQIPCLSWSIFL